MDIPVTASQSKVFPLNLGSEMGHACFRLTGTVAFCVYLALAYFSGHLGSLNNAVVGVSAYLAFSAIWIAVVGLSLLTFRTRRMLSIVLDQVVFAFAIYHAGDAAASVIWASVVMAIGNGLRNGTGYARLSSVLGGVSVGIALSLSPYWHTSKFVIEGIVLSILVLPAYTQMLSQQIAQAKREMQQRAARFESASLTDSLTGLMNRSGFFQCLQKLIDDVARNGTRSAVMLIDLDGFKAINDVCGHAAGDEVLKHVATRLHDCTEGTGRVARIGGDEFGIVVADASSLAELERLAQSLIDAVSGMQVAGRQDLKLGASIGICLLPDDDCRDETRIMETADRLMYQAKKSGKNQYRINPS
ncbi:MAG TPA: GGDEF domain-containing protein [Noviherbaspirillum sp.]|uniref:GGDEF domain-containing protein n=1 Tax=Noviherbaspirillum sp. TaxID=1926288 RepID=UPI002D66D569|nr:GGDEF domain-containing protein [Noviherbaspirillum sp.]HYD96178.1 GGDEF domain-containing protein [Noviherbaspirillum sp.]